MGDAGALTSLGSERKRGGTPDEARVEFLSALSAGDFRAALAFLARDACFVTPDATVVRGRSEIAAILAQMSAMQMELQADPLYSVLVAGNTALSPERWTARSSNGEVRSSLSRSVMVRVEGDWKLLIVAPWGWG